MRLRTLELPPLLKPSDHDRFLACAVSAILMHKQSVILTRTDEIG
jgi:hypothetical protein